jgi:hypothetical protein
MKSTAAATISLNFTSFSSRICARMDSQRVATLPPSCPFSTHFRSIESVLSYALQRTKQPLIITAQ